MLRSETLLERRRVCHAVVNRSAPRPSSLAGKHRGVTSHPAAHQQSNTSRTRRTSSPTPASAPGVAPKPIGTEVVRSRHRLPPAAARHLSEPCQSLRDRTGTPAPTQPRPGPLPAARSAFVRSRPRPTPPAPAPFVRTASGPPIKPTSTPALAYPHPPYPSGRPGTICPIARANVASHLGGARPTEPSAAPGRASTPHPTAHRRRRSPDGICPNRVAAGESAPSDDSEDDPPRDTRGPDDLGNRCGTRPNHASFAAFSTGERAVPIARMEEPEA